MAKCGRQARALTILSTLIVIAVVGVLATLGLIALAAPREKARSAVCVTILERYGEALAGYAADFGGVLAYENVGDEHLGHVVWYDALATYMSGGDRVCPSVDRTVANFEEGYRINSKLGRWSTIPPQPYRKLSSLDRPGATVVLFDAQYGGKTLSLKGQLKDAQFRHLGSLNMLLADWQVSGFDEKRLVEASSWLPPRVIWDPGVSEPDAVEQRRRP